jgi:peptidoglycan/LPS O-acetylase OafA/YrhL
MTWSSAALAVDLFFVLSGFVLAYAYEPKLPNASRAFLKARLIRLYPLYLVGTALGIVEALLSIHYVQGSNQWTWDKFWVALPLSLLMLPTPGQLYPFDGVMWSIFLELFVNVVWAAFWRPLQSTRILILVIALSGVGLVFSVAFTGTLVGLGAAWAHFLGGAFRVGYSFFLGVLLFRFHKRWPLPKLPPILLMIALPTVLFLPMAPFAQLFVVLFVLPWFVLLGSRVEPQATLEFVARKLGLASYAVYAVHKRLYLLTYAFALQVLRIDLFRFAPWIGVAFVLALIPACLLLNSWIDEPARRLLSARFRGTVSLASKERAS